MNNIKRLVMIFLVIVFAGGFIVMQSCGGDNNGKEQRSGTEAENADNVNVADEPEPTGEDTTAITEPPTEPPTTTEKPPVITEEILKWTVSEDNKIFRSGNMIKDLRVEDGVLKLTSTGGDPFLFTVDANLGIEASDVDYIKIRVKNHASGFRNQLFFITTDDMGWDEAKSIKEEYWNSDGEDWEILTYETFYCDYWEGTIKQIRFDPLEEEGDIEIEWVAFEKIVK